MRRRERSVYRTMAAATVAAVFAMPVVWLAASSFRSMTATFSSAADLSWRTFLPVPFTTENVTALVEAGYLRNVLNSLVVAGLNIVVGLLLCAMAAYALAVIEFPGRRIVFVAVVASFMVPLEAVAIPLAQTFREWGLADTVAGLVLPGLANGLAVFALRQFFLGVPHELREAAELDGAGHLRTFARIYLPLSKPALIGSGLIIFLAQWQAYLWPVLISSDPSGDLAPVAIARNFSTYRAEFGTTFAETLVIAILPAAVLLALQRFFVTTIASTGGKG